MTKKQYKALWWLGTRAPIANFYEALWRIGDWAEKKHDALCDAAEPLLALFPEEE